MDHQHHHHHHARTPSSSTTASTTTISSPVRRFVSRRPTLTAFAFAVATVGVGFKYISTTLRKNDMAQKSTAGSSFYVPVERSGGGI